MKRCLAPVVSAFFAFAAEAGLCQSAAPQGSVHFDSVSLIPGSVLTVRYIAPTDGPVYAHYGFNGWNYRTRGQGSGHETVLGNRHDFVRREMTRRESLGDGQVSWETRIRIPTTARSLHAAFCWQSCRNGEWDNNGGRDYNLSTRFPYLGPLLTWTRSQIDYRSITISFTTAKATRPYLEIWRRGRTPQRFHSRTDGVRHQFRLEGLASNQTYYYRVGNQSRCSQTYSFRTQPPPESRDQYSFLVAGDFQDNGESGKSSYVFREILENHRDVDFIAGVGDMVWNDEPASWWYFFDSAREILAQKPFLPVVGNHETPGASSHHDASSFVKHFPLPTVSNTKTYYHYRFGNLQFLALNSERRSELRPGGRQYEWADAEVLPTLASDDDTWTFAYWHIPALNAGGRHASQGAVTRAFAELLADRGAVDWVFSGHEHLYQRFTPLALDAANPVPVTSYPEGVGFLTIPSGGVPAGDRLTLWDESNDRPFLAYPAVSPDRVSVQALLGFTRVDIDGRNIMIRTFGTSWASPGAFRVIDTVQYRK